MNTDNISQWAKTLIDTHKNPLKKLEISGTKFFVPSGSSEEKEAVKESLHILTKTLKTERVERRCARSAAVWLPEQKLAKITKGGGILNTCGFANKNGRFLHPEEAVFLLEMNRLELFWNDIPLSIQQAYEVILREPECNVARYTAYRKMALQGFRLQRTETNTEEPKCKKQKLAEDKTAKIESSKEFSPVEEIFKKLRESGPKRLDVQPHKEGDYKIFVPDANRGCPNFNLHLSESKYINPDVGFFDDKAVVGYLGSEPGYFRFGRVTLPDL